MRIVIAFGLVTVLIGAVLGLVLLFDRSFPPAATTGAGSSRAGPTAVPTVLRFPRR